MRTLRLRDPQHDGARAAKGALSTKSPKTVNNVLTVLNVLMRTAVEWDVIKQVPCAIKLLRTPKTEASFYEFDQFERLVNATCAAQPVV